MIGFVTGLPRSRTYWFSQYLGGIPGVCAYHEALNGCLSKGHFYGLMERKDYAHVIDCDSGLVVSDYDKKWPDAPVVVIRRDPDEVFDSLCRFFEEQGYPHPNYEFLMAQEEAIEATQGLHVAFAEINCHLPAIHEHLGIPYDAEYAESMTEQVLNMPKLEVDVNSYLLWAEEA